MMRRTQWLRALVILLVLCIGLAPAAFAAGGSERPETGTAAPAAAAGPIDPLAPYDPPITQTAWRYLNAGIQFAPGDTIEDNVYIDMYRDDFGINLKYAWAVPEEQFEQKVNISIASGDLPDIMWLKNKQLMDLVESGDLYDLTELFELYTSDDTKSIIQQDQAAFDTAKIGGRLMAIPHTASSVDSIQILYVRTDWLENLGLKVPTTMQELLKVAEAFTTQDPDRNGRNDTFGLALTKNAFKITENHAAATGFVAGYHGYLRRWVKDGAGGLAYGSIQPQVRQALLALQDMYRRGLLDQEFGVKDRAKVTESITAGKVGITYGGMSSPGAFLKQNVLLDSAAEWQAIPLVSIDTVTAEPIAKLNVTRFYAVNKRNKHPEALLKLLENGTKGYLRGEQGQSPEDASKYGVTPEGIAVWQYQIIGYEPAMKNLVAHNNVLSALSTGDLSVLNAEERGYYDRIMLYRTQNDRNFWGDERIFGSPSSFDVVAKHVADKSYILDGFYGAYTPTMVERLATLDAMEDEVFTKIVMGEPIEAFDKFVADWKKLGGDQITREVNEWYARNK